MEKITIEDLKRMMLLSYQRIEEDKEKINKINVFPVPDKDTGSNLSKTLLGIKNTIEGKKFKDLNSFTRIALDGAFEAAQGNAGVIYAGFLAGFLHGLRNKNPINCESLAQAMDEGAIFARKSIQDPKEGTILDIIDVSAETIKNESKTDKDIISLYRKIIKNANLALLATRDKMEVFKKANVVDAGGLGYLIILESYLTALEGNNNSLVSKKTVSEKIRGFVKTISYRYEVVFLIKNLKTTREKLAQKLSEIGDSIEILKIKDRIKVHIHTNESEEVKKIAAESGDLQKIKTGDMAISIAGKKLLKKNNLGIVIEETSDIPKKIIEKYKLGFVSFTINWPEGDDLKGDNIYQKMREADKKGIKNLPKTSQPSPKKFLDTYKKTLKNLPKYSKIISIIISSNISGACNSAYQASQMMEIPSNIFILDSFQASSGLALLVLKAIELREEQKNFKEIINELNKALSKIQLYGAVEDPKWLESGGRINHSQATWMRRMKRLGICPIFKLKDGKIEKEGIVFGVKDLATAIFKKIKSKSSKIRKKGKKIRIVINHCDNKVEAEKLKKMLKEINAEVSYINLVGPTVGTHVGPGSLIAAWMAID